jgi:hypothetical protein
MVAPGVDFAPGFSKFLTCPSLASTSLLNIKQLYPTTGGAERSEVGAPGVDFTPGFSKFLTCPSLACPRPSSRTNFPCPTPKIKNTTSNTYERYLPDRPTRRWCNAKVAAGGCWWQIRTLDVLGCAHTTAITRRTEINCDASIKFSTVVLKSLWKTNHETPHHSAMTWLNPLCTIEVQSKKILAARK